MTDIVDRELPMGPMGYAIEQESHGLLMAQGIDPEWMLERAEESKPTFQVDVDPMTLFEPFNQGNQGSCQGSALANVFQICYFLETGRIIEFSRAAGYYLSQRKDGINGDRGSTLSGGQWVATQHGMCLEKDWPYPKQYNPREPEGISYPYKLVAAQPTSDYELICKARDLGLPVHDGIIWDSSVNRPLSTDYKGSGGGGHSTVLWTMDGENTRRLNTWGYWNGSGCNLNTPRSLKQQVEHRYSSHVIYAPAGMIYPEQEPVR